MNTELLYLTDSYLKEFDAEIIKLSSDGNNVYLNKTAFYPGGGGQMNDQGKLIWKGKDFSVVEVGRDNNKEVFHKLSNQLKADVGTKIRGIIDWEKRYTAMRYHTALHILCGIIWKEFNAFVTGGQIYLDKARMDFNLDDFSNERVKLIEKRVNEEIKASREIIVKILPRNEAFKIPDLIRTKINLLPPEIKEVRIVEIVGLDLQADGGTHVKNTREVGLVKIIETINKGKENKRMVIKLD